MKSSVPSVSAIIPSYNSFKTIEYTLKSLLNQPGEVLKEIIIVDSSDDDMTHDILSKYSFGKIKIIYLAQRTIQAVARNLGAKNASGDILLFIDSDTCLAEGWVSRMLIAYNSGCLIGSGSVSLPSFQKSKAIPLAEYFLISNHNINTGRCRETKVLTGCNLFCDRVLFEKVGGFPPDMGILDDMALGWNVSAFEKLLFIPELMVHHTYRQDLWGFLRNQKLHGKSNITYRESHYNYWIYRGFIPLLLLPFFLFVKFTAISLRVFRSGISKALRFAVVSPVVLLGLLFWGLGFASGCVNNNILKDSK